MDWFILFFGFILWAIHSEMHIMYAEDAQHYAQHIVKQCVCHEAHIPKGATLAQKMAAEDYARDMCEEKCGMPEMKCGLDRASYETYADYKKQCRAARKGAAAEEPALTKVNTPAEDGW